MLTPQTGKGRSQRVELDYFRRPDSVLRWKRLGGVMAAVAAGAFAIYAASPLGSKHVSTGPLSHAHAAIEADCMQCHIPFSPVASDAAGATAAHRVAAANGRCQNCHPLPTATASTHPPVPGHFDARLSSDAAGRAACAACHSEHRGRDHRLAAVASTDCTSCHADLAGVVGSQKPLRVEANVASFSQAGHPEFRYGREGADDPGRVKFDHHQHMLAGQVEAGMRGGMQWEQLPEKHRRRYQQADGDGGLVQLRCADCHVLGPEPQAGGDREIGRRFQPIVFEQHCSACHELNYPGRDDQVGPIPHPATSQEVRRLLTGAIGGRLLAGEIPAGEATPRVGAAAPAIEPSPLDRLPELVEAGIAAVEAKCLQCHDAASIQDEAIAAQQQPGASPLIPHRWLTRGLFSHAAHRQMDCRGCHAAAFPDASPSAALQAEHPSDRPAEDHTRIMIAGIASCIACHRDGATEAPSSTSLAEITPIPAPADCSTCHRYHWTRPDSPHALAGEVAER